MQRLSLRRARCTMPQRKSLPLDTQGEAIFVAAKQKSGRSHFFDFFD